MRLQGLPDAKPRRCSRCGADLPPDAPGGNCPACLWGLLVEADEPAPVDAPRPFGSYELVEEIARGGMGVVWRARQQGLARDVALKMILTGQLATSSQVVRFYTEARAAARLDDPGIVPIHDIGEDAGRHYYTMMLMEGGSLADRLRSGLRLSPGDAARILLPVARAIHFAHQRGVLHRDVKPSNILLDGQGRPRVADFGLARIADADGASASSRSNPVLGTPAYMAPEQASGNPREVTIAADVYGLGAVLYELLTGAPPFLGATAIETIRHVVETEPRPPRTRNPQVDRDLDVICLKCLQKDPQKRYASAAELANDIERWLKGEPILARPVSSVERLASWARRKPDLAKAIGVLFFVLIAALATTLILLVSVGRQSSARARALRAEESQRLAFQSLAVVRENPGQALLLALEGASRSPSLSVNSALMTALEACRERRRLLGHESVVNSAAFSPDGEWVATASHDRTARIWSASSNETALVLRGHTKAVRTAAFRSDGKRVITSSDDATARIWDAASGALILTLAGHEHPLTDARFSPDGALVLTVGQNTARLWDAETGQALHVLDRHTARVTCGVFSPDGTRAATGSSDRRALVWRTDSGAVEAELTGHTTFVTAIAFSADGKWIVTGSEPEAHVWDATTYKKASEIHGHAHGIYSVALTSDGATLLTGSEDFSARVWEARTGKPLHVLWHGHKVVRVEISSDDQRALTASYDRTARVWDLATGRPIAELKGHAAPVVDAAFSLNGRSVVTSCVDFTARVWSVEPATPLVLPPPVICADISKDGALLVKAMERQRDAVVEEASTRRPIATLSGHEDAVLTARFSHSGATVMTTSRDDTARLWDAASGRPLRVLAGHTDDVLNGAFSPDGSHVVTMSADRTARLWNAGDGTLEREFRPGALVRSAAFSPDSTRLAIVDDAARLEIFSLSDGVSTPFAASNRIGGADFGPDGTTIALAVGTTRAQVRRLQDQSLVTTLVHPARTSYLFCSPDRRWIATLGEDGVIRVWDASTYEERLVIGRSGWLPYRPQFLPDSEHIVIAWNPIGVRDGAVLEVMIYPIDVLEAARQARFGELTPDERDHFRIGTAEERSELRRRWTGGHIYGPERGDTR